MRNYIKGSQLWKVETHYHNCFSQPTVLSQERYMSPARFLFQGVESMDIPLKKHCLPSHGHQKIGKSPEIILHERKEISISKHFLMG